MNKLFLVYDETQYTYEKLRVDLNEMDSQSSFLYIKNNDPYVIFLTLIHSLVYDYPLEVLDGDFTEAELRELNVNMIDISQKHKVNEPLLFPNVDSIIDRIQAAENWRLILYTSGTTGRPKKVSHTFEGFTRNVKQQEKFAEDVWALAFNPTHMAGLQVFFQALLNKNTMIYTFGDSMKELPNLIEQYKITCISATSTFYRSVLPFFNSHTYPYVKRVTFGGEKYDSALGEKMGETFPNASIRNIYASTEAGSLFSAVGDLFEIKKEYLDFVKISQENELLVHQSFLGASDSYTLEGEWFHTGDLVEPVGVSQFKFATRQSDLINIGGYKVNPSEVENILEQIPGVNSALVKGRKNSVTGEILVADVVKAAELDSKELKKEIKQYASIHLQEWKVPRIIKFVDELPMTRTGKKVRT